MWCLPSGDFSNMALDRRTVYGLVFVFVALMASLAEVTGQVRARLVNGSTADEGRVEVFYNEEWGTVCDDKWENADATVICKMLPDANNYVYGEAVVAGKTKVPPYGAGSDPIWLDEVGCTGVELSIEQCSHSGWGRSDCNHEEDAGVRCISRNAVTSVPTVLTTTLPPTPQPSSCVTPNEDVRLVGSNAAGIGYVEVKQPTSAGGSGTWGVICDDTFGRREAMIICRMLCLNVNVAKPGGMTTGYSHGNGVILDGLRCTGSEAVISDCTHKGWGTHSCTVTEAASVTCTSKAIPELDPPVPVLHCENGFLRAEFNTTKDPNLEPKHLSVLDVPSGVACNPLKDRDVPNDVVFIEIKLDECNIKPELNSSHIIYNVDVLYDYTSNTATVVQVNRYRITLSCDYPRNGTVDEGSIQTHMVNVSQRAPGAFTFAMQFYEDNGFTTPITSFPIRIPLGKWVNVSVTLQNSGLKLVVPNCKVTPTKTGTTPSFPLITNKCANSQVPMNVYPWNATQLSFNFETFKFVGDYDSLYLSCEAFVCELNEKNPACDQTCGVRKRRRRHALHETHQLYRVPPPGVVIMYSSDVAPRADIIQLPSRTESTTTTRSTQIESTRSGKSDGMPDIVSGNQDDEGNRLSEIDMDPTRVQGQGKLFSDEGNTSSTTHQRTGYNLLIICLSTSYLYLSFRSLL